MSRAKATQVPGAAAAATAAAPIPESKPEVDVAGLPNAVDVDARALRGPVLTRQGWVTPDEAWQKANPAEFQKLLQG
jgi:hypothetical protein